MQFSDFVKSLDNSNKEIFDSVVIDITQQGSIDQIKELELKLKEVKKQIDEINSDRQKLSHEAKRCEDLIDLLDNYIKEHNAYENMELSCFKILLSTWLKDLKDMILEEKPVELLQKKYKIRKVIDNRIDRNNIVTTLIKKIKNGS